MAKRSYISSSSRIITPASVEVIENSDDQVEVPVINEPTVYEPEKVLIRSRRDMRIRVAGFVTGIVYEFLHAGSQVEVDERDVENLLKRMGNGCCGAASSPWFEKVGG